MEYPRSYNPQEKITGLRIPDDDVRGWMEALRSMGLDETYIDNFLIQKNSTYAKLKLPEIVENVAKEIETTFKTTLSPEQRRAVQKWIEEKYVDS